jgi:hypothetical protein
MLAGVDMTEIYSESPWRLFDELDMNLKPAGPEQLYEIADPYLAPVNASWMSAAATAAT